jgi:MoxR-like ATPase
MTSLRALSSRPIPALPFEGPQRWRDAPNYAPQADLITAIDVAMALRQPLLLTGEPGCGKTSAAYWVAWRLGLKPSDLVHAQIRSDASAARLKYEFDAVRYFRESQIAAHKAGRARDTDALPAFDEDRRRFIFPGPLWMAFEASQVKPTVLLLDEIDKAPRDLPNDLLLEFDAKEFEVSEWEDPLKRAHVVRAGEHLVLIVFTSNGERQLPDAFLRRCIHHHSRFSPEELARVVEHRIKVGDITLARPFVDWALERFVALKGLRLQHSPGTAELLVWMRALAMTENLDVRKLRELRLAELPYLGTLLKNVDDLDAVAAGR